MSDGQIEAKRPRAPVRLLTDGDGARGPTVGRLLERMRQSAFQGRKLGEAFEVWQRMIDGDGLICLGLAGSLASAGLGPLVAWLVERGYVDVVASTSANATVYASTNLNDWVAIGAATQIAPGFYQFTDPASTNLTRRFYQLRVP